MIQHRAGLDDQTLDGRGCSKMPVVFSLWPFAFSGLSSTVGCSSVLFALLQLLCVAPARPLSVSLIMSAFTSGQLPAAQVQAIPQDGCRVQRQSFLPALGTGRIGRSRCG